MEPFLTVIKAFLEKRMVSALMVGLVNLANTIPAMQAWKKIKDWNCVKPLGKWWHSNLKVELKVEKISMKYFANTIEGIFNIHWFIDRWIIPGILKFDLQKNCVNFRWFLNSFQTKRLWSPRRGVIFSLDPTWITTPTILWREITTTATLHSSVGARTPYLKNILSIEEKRKMSLIPISTLASQLFSNSEWDLCGDKCVCWFLVFNFKCKCLLVFATIFS